ncbi:cation diffusion facilitator family transporter [Arthrobacter sp. TMN-50]
MNAHDHGLPQRTATGRHRRKLIVVVGITLAVVFVQVVGAIWSGSLALLADAGHMLSDAAGVSIALFASWIASRPATQRSTYGYQRAEVLAALANAIILVVIAVVILIEALRRFNTTPDIRSDVMIVTAVVGAVANLACLLILRRGQTESLNLRGAYLEVLGDLLGSMAVIIAAVVIAMTGYLPADALASIAIALMILPRAWSLLRDVINVLLESAPKGVDSEMIRSHILGVRGVVGVHDIHAWTITSGVPVFSAHVVVDGATLNAEGVDQVLDRLTHCLRNHFDTQHCTFQLEPAEHAVHESRQHA